MQVGRIPLLLDYPCEVFAANNIKRILKYTLFLLQNNPESVSQRQHAAKPTVFFPR